MANNHSFLKDISQAIARYTKYVHIAIFLSIWMALVPLGISMPTDFPISLMIRIGYSFLFALPIYCIFGFLFWALPALIVRIKKKQGKDWSGVLVAANLIMVRYVILTCIGLSILFSIGLVVSRESDSKQEIATNIPIESIQNDQDYANLFVEYIEKAEQGDAEAQFQLAKLYDDGKGVEQDKKAAIRWYKIAVDQGLAKAQFNLALMYDDGDGIPQNKAEAVKYYKMATDQGHTAAQFNLALMYDDGDGIPQNKAEAAKYYKMAADQGDAKAQNNYATMCFRGEGVQQDEKEAFKMLCKAAENRDEKAQFRLGLRYIEGKGVKKNPEKALKWFLLAAEQGDPELQFYVGRIYAYGIRGIPENKEEAVKWLSLSAQQGNKEAKKILKQYGAFFK